MFSPFIYQFVLNSIVFSSLVLVVALMLATFYRKTAATVFACGFGGLVIAFLVPLLFLFGSGTNRQHRVEIPIEAVFRARSPFGGLGFSNVSNGTQVRESQVVGEKQKDKSTKLVHSSTPSASSTGFDLWVFFDWAIVVSTLVSGILLLRLGGALIGISQMFQHSKLITPIAHPELTTLIGQLSQHRVTLRSFRGLKSPIAMQFPKRAILVPDDFLSATPYPTVCRVIEHERAHLLRNDHLTLLIQELIVCIYWFNPLVHFTKRIVNCAREDVCDNWVLAKFESTEYCRDLVSLSEAKAIENRLAPGLLRSKDIGRRVRSLLNTSRIAQVSVSRKMSTLIGSLLLANGLMAFFVGIGFTQDREVEQDPAQLTSEEILSLKHSYTNPQQIRAIVTDRKTGEPVEDADVKLLNVNWLTQEQGLLSTTSTNMVGEFEFRDLNQFENQDLVVLVSHQSYSSQIHGLRNSLNYLQNKDNWTISLGRRASLTGRFTDDQGNPIEGVEIWQPVFLNEPVPGFLYGKTGADGRFKITDHSKFNPEMTRRDSGDGVSFVQPSTLMMYRHPDYGRAYISVEKIPSDIELVLEKAFVVKGRAIEKATGKPLSNLVVTARSHDSPSFDDTKTDEKGNFQFSLSPKSKFNIWAQHEVLDAPAKTVEGTSGQTIVVNDLEFEPLVAVKGFVIDDETGKPFRTEAKENFTIMVYDAAQPKTTGACKSAPINPDGTFELNVVPGEIFPYVGNASLIQVGPGLYKEGVMITREEPVDLEFRVRKRTNPY